MNNFWTFNYFPDCFCLDSSQNVGNFCKQWGFKCTGIFFFSIIVRTLERKVSQGPNSLKLHFKFLLIQPKFNGYLLSNAFSFLPCNDFSIIKYENFIHTKYYLVSSLLCCIYAHHLPGCKNNALYLYFCF